MHLNNRRHNPFGKVEDAHRLATGAAFRLYHSQSESFVSASCDPEKGEVLVDDDGDGRADRFTTQKVRLWHDSAHKQQQQATTLPAHIPYLKVSQSHLRTFVCESPSRLCRERVLIGKNK